MKQAQRVVRAVASTSRTVPSARAAAVARQQGIRAFTLSSSYRQPAKDSQDRNTLKPQSTEYGISGSDNEAAHTKAAFEPNKNDPQEQVEDAGKESGSEGDNPLRVSPADVDVNTKAADENEHVENTEGQATGNAKASGGRRQSQQPR